APTANTHSRSSTASRRVRSRRMDGYRAAICTACLVRMHFGQPTWRGLELRHRASATVKRSRAHSMRLLTTSNNISMSRGCSRSRVELSRQRCREPRPFRVFTWQSEAQPPGSALKNPRPDTHARNPLLHCAPVAGCVEPEQRRPAYQTPAGGVSESVESQGFPCKTGRCRKCPVAVEQGSPSDLDRGAGYRPRTGHPSQHSNIGFTAEHKSK